MKKVAICVLTAFATLLSGCNGRVLEDNITPKSHVEIVEDMQEEVEEKIVEDTLDNVVVFEKPSDQITTHYTKVSVPKNPVDIDIPQAVPFSYIIDSIAEEWGWSVHYRDGVDINKPVAVKMSNIDLEEALEDVAAMAGYTVVMDSKKRRCTVAKRATWTFLLPSRLTDSLTWDYTVGGSPATESEASADIGVEAASTISGQSLVGASDILEVLANAVNSDNDGDAAVVPAVFSNLPSLGVLLITGDLNQLRRAESLIARMVREATTKVEINVAILDISLTEEQSLGIQWSDVIRNASTAKIPIGSSVIGSPVAFDAPSIDFGYTTSKGLDVILRALDKVAEYSIVSRPNLLIDNHTPADISDSRAIPYIASIDRQVSGDNSDNVTVSAETAVATDGIKLSVLPHVLPGSNVVQLKLVPYFGVVAGETVLEYISSGSSSSFTYPDQTIKQAFISVTVDSGSTIILAGNRYSSTTKTDSGLPVLKPLAGGESNRSNIRELAIIINTRVIPPPAIDVVLEKSL